MPLQPNALLNNRYRVMGELGRGGMGAVYRAYDEVLNVDVAVKENLFTSPEAERQFRREASLLATLRHPNLPRVTDHFIIPGQGQYLVMDYIAGENAKKLLEEHGGPLDERSVLRWARQILDALFYLHSQIPPILHRDVKPGNLKISADGHKAVLVDFGLAKVHDEKQSTTTGAKAFTPGFAPPEQYGLGRTDARTDLYALAATLYNLLTNKMPADGLDRAMGQKQLVPVRQLNPALSARTAEAIERALSIRPEERFGSAADFLAALPSPEELTAPAATATTVRRETPEPVPTVVSAPPAARRRFPSPGFISVAVVMTLVSAVGGVLAAQWWRSAPPPAPSATPTLEPTVVSPATATAPINAASTPTTAPQPEHTSAPTLVPTSPTNTTPEPSATAGTQATPIGGGASGQIAFVSERGGLPQVFVMNADGSEQTPLTNQREGACQPAWSPDGAYLLFVSPCQGKANFYPNGSLYRIRADGTEVQPLITLLGGAFDAEWSLSGIVFTNMENNRPQVYVAAPDGSNPQRISSPVSADRRASWSPDGERLVFLNTSRSGRPTLYWMNKDGTFGGNSNPYQVTRDISADAPAWSPDGALVAFISDFNLYMVPWDQRGFGVQSLRLDGLNDDPAWSPDGQWLAVTSWAEGATPDIYLVPFAGGEAVRLTNDPARDYQPAWKP